MAQEATVVPVEEAEGLCQVVVLQRGEIIVLNSQRVAGFNQEVVVQPLVV